MVQRAGRQEGRLPVRSGGSGEEAQMAHTLVVPLCNIPVVLDSKVEVAQVVLGSKAEVEVA